MKKPSLSPSPRIQFLSIAGSLAAAASILGLTAFETCQTEDLQSVLRMREGTEFGVDIQTEEFKENETIVPDGTAVYDPYITNKGNYDVYTFIEINYDNNAFEIIPSEGWTKLSIDGRNIYAYGAADQLTVLSSMKNNEPTPSTRLCNTIRLNRNDSMEEGQYIIHAIGYAIQSDDIGTSDPLAVWNKLDGGST